MLNALWQQFYLHQLAHITTYNHGGILDLVFDIGRCDQVYLADTCDT